MAENSGPGKNTRPGSLSLAFPSLLTPKNAKASALAKEQAAAKALKVSTDQKVAQQLSAAKKEAAKIIKDAKTAAAAIRVKDQGANLNGNDSPPPPKGDYYYNAPMVKYNYFGNTGSGLSPQEQTDGVSNFPGNFGQGEDAWSNVYGAKGVIQMDRSTAKDYANNVDPQGNSYDPNLYGFKFLYNPTEVTMGWGVAEGQNWEGIAAGLDAGGNAFTQALQNSRISFSLLLNRTLDMNYLDANGLIPGLVSPYPVWNRPAGRSANEELAEIYKKGTMYDMEYLFRTIMGVNSTFNNSLLPGLTADKGWLQGVAVQLHLGSSLRYLVRVSSLELNHAMFNDRMVPTLSYLTISLARFNDDQRFK